MQVRYGQVSVAGILGKLIRNPEYGGKRVGHKGWVYTPMISCHDKPEFQEALRDSISKEGIRNPIIVYAFDSGDYLGFGGSRLRAAREVGLTHAPAIINDHCGRYEDFPEVTAEGWEGLFTDVPRYFEFGTEGVDTHYSLEKNRRNDFDDAGLIWCGEADFLTREFSWINN